MPDTCYQGGSEFNPISLSSLLSEPRLFDFDSIDLSKPFQILTPEGETKTVTVKGFK